MKFYIPNNYKYFQFVKVGHIQAMSNLHLNDCSDFSDKLQTQIIIIFLNYSHLYFNNKIFLAKICIDMKEVIENEIVY